MPSSHLILCRPLILLPPIPPSIRVFSNESTLCMRWPKYWSVRFSISPSNEHPGLYHPAKPRWGSEHSCVSWVLFVFGSVFLFICFWLHSTACGLFQILFHYILLWGIEYSSLCYIVGPSWLFIFFVVMDKEAVVHIHHGILLSHSAIKKNSFESVLMRWMKLEPIIQSEVSQKDKDHYNVPVLFFFCLFFFFFTLVPLFLVVYFNT